jgi:hypothetical protein
VKVEPRRASHARTATRRRLEPMEDSVRMVVGKGEWPPPWGAGKGRLRTG